MSSLPNGLPRRIATLSVHTSPLDQPGTGDAGGLNVYVVEVAKRLAARGTEVEIFTRAVCRDTPPLAELAPGVLVRSVVGGPVRGAGQDDLPAQVCQFTLEVLRAEAAAEPGRYDLVHAHYWLSGKVGAAAKERWGVPLVQSMHTLGKVKNAALAAGDAAEPDERIKGEHEVVAAADRLIANTAQEARQLTELYGADPAKVRTVNPGADLSVFRPGGPEARAEARRRLGIAPDAVVLLFVGRVQPLKGPDVVLKAAARLVEGDPALRETAAGRHRRRPERAAGARRPGPDARAGRPARDQRHRPVRAAMPAGRARPVVPGGDAWCSRRRTRSRSGWWPLRRRPAAPPSWRPASAACAPWSRTATRASSWTATTRPTGRGSSGTSSGRRGAWRHCPRARARHASAFGWSATVDRLARVYTGAMDEAYLAGRQPLGSGADTACGRQTGA